MELQGAWLETDSEKELFESSENRLAGVPLFSRSRGLYRRPDETFLQPATHCVCAFSRLEAFKAA
jgi:hypothetical protein